MISKTAKPISLGNNLLLLIFFSCFPEKNKSLTLNNTGIQKSQIVCMYVFAEIPLMVFF